MEISGLGVSKGRVKGIVKIITDKESIETFTEGNILIAKNVSPKCEINPKKRKLKKDSIGA